MRQKLWHKNDVFDEILGCASHLKLPKKKLAPVAVKIFYKYAAATLFPPHAARAHFAIPSPQRGTAIVRRNLGGGSTKSMSPTSPERDEWRGTAEVRRKCGEGRRVYRGVVIANLSVVCWAHTHANFRIKI